MPFQKCIACIMEIFFFVLLLEFGLAAGSRGCCTSLNALIKTAARHEAGLYLGIG